MTDAERDAMLDEVREWLRHPEAADYRLFKLKVLLERGYVDLQQTVAAWTDRHRGT